MGCGSTKNKVRSTIVVDKNFSGITIHHQINNFNDLFEVRISAQILINQSEKDEIFGDNGIKDFYNRTDIDTEAMNTAVKEESFNKHFKDSLYSKWFDATQREHINLLEAIEDILILAPKNKNTYMKFYNEFKTKPHYVATLIWTYEPSNQGEIKLYKLINMALVIDAKNTFGKELKGNIDFASDFIKEYKISDIDYIIKHSIKFIRILNTAIVDEGICYNEDARVTYRGAANKVFKYAEIGDCYRIITWSSSSEDKNIAENFRKESVNGGSMVKFNIPMWCCNAGKINSIGKSCIPIEKETLIPPYTSIKLRKAEEISSVMNYEVLVTKDNKKLDFDIDNYVTSSDLLYNPAGPVPSKNKNKSPY